MASESAQEGSAIEQVFAGGARQRLGWYRYYFADDRWIWSDEVAVIHGYAPGTVTPTTDLVLSHKHPDDYEQVASTLREIRRTHKPFSTRHRIITTKGDTREVVVIGERIYDGSGAVIGTQGFYVDATPRDYGSEQSISARVAEITDSRAAIEQAKGALMFIYGIDAEAAFELIRWRSQETNVKLRALAEQILEDIRALHDETNGAPSRLDCDRILLTAHHRAKSKAAG